MREKVGVGLGRLTIYSLQFRTMGKFIAIYGVNNMGKSTHSALLVERLKSEGFDAVYVKFPVYDLAPSGIYLNQILRGGKQEISEEALQMWFTVNRFQFAAQLERWLEEGKIVVAEDYIGTGIAWGMTKGLKEEWLRAMNEPLRKPDLAILIEGERSMAAVEKDHVHEQDDDLVARCYKNFQYLAEKDGWERVELQPGKSETAKLIWQIVKKVLE